MSKIMITSPKNTNTQLKSFLEKFERRIQATPPGICPIVLQISLLEECRSQTCTKCVPCRDGIPQLVEILKKIGQCQGTREDLEQARALAELIRDTSDCAIGYDAGAMVLEGMEKFREEYEMHLNYSRCNFDIKQSVPCETMCPAHVNVPGYIALVEEGRYGDAVNMVRKDNPFPTACALICEHPCEEKCRRTIIDSPINIRGIKKFAVDQAHADQVPCPQANPSTGRKVAVIGAGPSGLTCAYFLALMGHHVDVYEEKSKPGGMLRYGIPAYRFPRERLDEDISAILSVGNIEIKCNTPVGAQQMSRFMEEYDGIYVAIGAHTEKKLRIDNVDAGNVISAVNILREIGDGNYPDFTDKNVVIVGGGNVAMDCARTSVRCGAKSVSIVYRRRKEDMTALPEEIESAVAEGVELITLQAPIGVETDEQGNCRALLVQPQMIGPVKGGRPAPVNANKPQEKIQADVILLAVGQDVVCQPFEEFGMKTERNCFKATPYLEAEGFDKLFVGGDCQTGPATVIKAVAAGKVAARNIDEYMGYHHKLNCGVETPLPKENDRTPKGRVNIAERPARVRKNDFKSVEIEMSLEEAIQECGRCLRCDHYGCGSMEGGRVTYD